MPVNIAVLTVSDTRSLEEDKSGDLLSDRIKGAGHNLQTRDLVKDSKSEIIKKLNDWISTPEIDVVIATGGTGLTGRDVTPEAFKSVFEKEIPGLSLIHI